MTKLTQSFSDALKYLKRSVADRTDKYGRSVIARTTNPMLLRKLFQHFSTQLTANALTVK